MIDEASRRWIGYALDLTERKRNEAALVFLAEASDLLSQSLDYQETLQRLAVLVVPRLADWCTVAVREDDGEHPQRRDRPLRSRQGRPRA